MFKIYTRAGDKGSTGLSSGPRLAKSELVFETLGDLDEAQAMFAELYHLNTTAKMPKQIILPLKEVQQLLFGIGAHVARTKGWEKGGLVQDDIEQIEDSIDEMELTLAPLKNFIIPTGPAIVTRFHLTRAVVRRMERHLVALHRKQPVADFVLAYINRLSDWLFVAARVAAKKTGTKELCWIGDKRRQPPPQRIKKS